jgi:hypothetical protein
VLEAERFFFVFFLAVERSLAEPDSSIILSFFECRFDLSHYVEKKERKKQA